MVRMWRMTSSPLGASASRSSSARACGLSGIVLGDAVEDAAARADRRRVVVAPRRARQLEQALALREALLGVRVGIDEDVLVVERGDEPGGPAPQHAVAEHVARHVADAGHRERLALHVEAQVPEVVLDALPGAAGGDAFFLVVVAVAAAGGERVAQPEAVLRRDLIGGVGEVRGALVGRHDQIRIVVVVAHHLGRMHDLAVDDVVGDVEQA